MAVLDAILEDGPCHDLALELKRRGVPFLICSGMPPDETEPKELAGYPAWTSHRRFLTLCGLRGTCCPNSRTRETIVLGTQTERRY